MNKCLDDAVKKFKVITTAQFFYIVEAKNKDDALDKCLEGEIEVYNYSVINDEVTECKNCGSENLREGDEV